LSRPSRRSFALDAYPTNLAAAFSQIAPPDSLP